MAIDGETLRDLAIKVSQYFLEFLESDFKRQQAPRRQITLQTEAGLRSGMRIATYSALQHNLWQILEKRSDGELALTLQPRTYTRSTIATLRGVIREQVHVLAEASLGAIRTEIVSKAQATRERGAEDPEAWLGAMREGLAGEIASRIVRPLLARLDGPLSHHAYCVRDSIFSVETELVERVAAKLSRAMPEALARYLVTGDATSLVVAAEVTLSLDETRAALIDYFEAFTAADAYLEFRDLQTCAAAGENLQVYLYIGALRYANSTYPVLYVPLEVRRMPDGGGFTLSLVNRLYANKRAIDFVVQELGERQGRGWLSPIKERITYLTPDQSILDAARPLFRQIADAVELGGRIGLDTGTTSEAANTDVHASPPCSTSPSSIGPTRPS